MTVAVSPSADIAAQILSEALPSMQHYSGKVVVIKYGGHVMGDDELGRQFAGDVIQLRLCGICPIVVHGGGPQIGDLLSQLNIESRFVNGLRVTDRHTMAVVEMVLCGPINKAIVARINAMGGRAVGLSGKDDNLVVARRYGGEIDARDGSKIPDIGFVGVPEKINPHIVTVLAEAGMIPVIAPVAGSLDGKTYNINADTMAGALAAALHAARLLILTDTKGILDRNGEPIKALTLDAAHRLIDDGTVRDGMIPKLETCITAVNSGVESAVILDGRISHAVLLELFTDHGAGTMIRR